MANVTLAASRDTAAALPVSGPAGAAGAAAAQGPLPMAVKNAHPGNDSEQSCLIQQAF